MACHFPLGCCVNMISIFMSGKHVSAVIAFPATLAHWFAILCIPSGLNPFKLFAYQTALPNWSLFLHDSCTPTNLLTSFTPRNECCIWSVPVPSDWNCHIWKERGKKYFLIISYWIFHFTCCRWVHAVHDCGIVTELLLVSKWGSRDESFMCCSVSCYPLFHCNSRVFWAEEANRASVATSLVATPFVSLAAENSVVLMMLV